MVHATSTRSNPLDHDRIRAVIAPVLSAHGVALVDLEWKTERSGWTLRLTIERPDTNDLGGGVTLDDCAEVSRDVSAVLDVEDFIPHAYALEVSSPGLERRLRGEADFVRFVGRTAKLKLAQPASDGQRVLRGAIDAAPPGRVAVIVDGKRMEVSTADVVDAHLVFELAPEPKKGSQKNKGARPKAARASKR